LFALVVLAMARKAEARAPASRRVRFSETVDYSASGDAKAFVSKALTGLRKHPQELALARKQLCAYQDSLCQDLKMFRVAEYPPIVPPTATFTGGGREPTLGNLIMLGSYVSEGFDSYVLVSSPTGLGLVVPFEKTTTIQDFKHLVADIATIDVDDFVLLFGCNILAEDDLTMEDFGIESGSMLGLVIDEPEMKVAVGDGFQKEA